MYGTEEILKSLKIDSDNLYEKSMTTKYIGCLKPGIGALYFPENTIKIKMHI